MKIYYVDAENIGFSMLDKTTFHILDRVFVFTNSETIKSEYNNMLLTCVSGYPTGKNQADFYIIAHLSIFLSNLSKSDKKLIEFNLLSKDQNLWKAFEYQCSLAGVKSSAPYIAEKIEPNNAEESIEISIGEEILKLMTEPITSYEIQHMLNLSQSEFTKAINQLINTGKIMRHEKSKKYWVRVEELIDD